MISTGGSGKGGTTIGHHVADYSQGNVVNGGVGLISIPASVNNTLIVMPHLEYSGNLQFASIHWPFWKTVAGGAVQRGDSTLNNLCSSINVAPDDAPSGIDLTTETVIAITLSNVTQVASTYFYAKVHFWTTKP
jgi:hypothetical protein